MALAKMNRLVILAGILAILLAALAWLQNGQEEVKQNIIPEMEVASNRLANLDLAPLQERIVILTETDAQATANATRIQEHFAAVNEGLDVGDTLYLIARENRVNLYQITSSGLAPFDFEGISGTGLPLTLTVRGEAQDILNFIDSVHETYPLGQLNTIAIDNSLHGTVREATEIAYVEGEIHRAAQAILQLTIRNYLVSDDSG